MKTVNTQGMPCPLPIVMTRKALETLEAGESLEVILDNENSAKNVTRFLEDQNMVLQTEKEGKMIRIVVQATGEIPEEVKPEDYCNL
jgi:TusA-related sulfurtransferase